MNNKNEFNPGVVRRFLKVAAIALAVGSNPALVRAGESEGSGPPRGGHENRSTRRSQEAQFPLAIRPTTGIGGEAAPERIRVRVLDTRGRCPVDTTVSGPCHLGPLPAGDYLVMYKSQGRVDWQRLSLGAAPIPEILVRGVA
ncbi:MAG: hypothetical protein RBS40_13850 [Rhodocyclaceae bacterium]|jgi:hypothetical protein|nr:hypothetical protein [Rhodocyclaceae bacterium]